MDNNFYKNFQDDVIIEKSSLSLAAKTLKYEKVTFKKVVIDLVLLAISLFFTYIIIMSNNTKNIFESILTDSFSFSVGITGFLVAGVSIFFTMIQSDTMYALLLLKNDKTNENMFKSILLAFIKPFVFLIFIIAYNFTYKLTNTLIFNCFQIYNQTLYYKIIAGICILVLIIFILKSIFELIYFIYNIYAFIMFIAKDLISQKMINNLPNMDYKKYLKILEQIKNDEFNSK